MLNPEDRRAIEGLFSRLEDVERRAPARDWEAEQLIDKEIVRLPAAPYYLAQTVLVQEHALEVAERRIRELESELARRQRGGLFGGLFDDGRQAGAPARRDSTMEDQAGGRAPRGPWDRDDGPTRRGRDVGFLAGAAQTAMGVTGGLLLGSAIASLLGGGAAEAAEAPADTQDMADQQEVGGGEQADNDFGDFGDGGGFDMGGDF